MLSIQTPSILGKQREFAVKTEPLRSRGTQQENMGRGFEIDSMCAHLRGVLELLMGDVKHCVDFLELFLLFLLLHTFFSVAWMRVCATLKFPLGEMEGKKNPPKF